MVNSYDNIDFCIEVLYNFLNNNNDCYQLIDKKLENIQINDLKKSDIFKDYEDILNNNFEYIGYLNNKYKFKNILKDKKYEVLISKYDNLLKRNSLNNNVINNIRFLYYLGQISINLNYKLVTFSIMSFDIKIKEIEKINKKIYDKIKYKDEIVNVLITENFNDNQTLNKYLDKNISNIDFRYLSFKILYSLSLINEKLTNFVHNNLNLDSIIICKNKNKNYAYSLGYTSFKIDEDLYDIKITDFDKSTCDEILKINNEVNLYHDIINIFYNIYKKTVEKN